LTIDAHRGAVTDLAFSPDGAVLASASDDASIGVWDVDGRAIRRLEAHADTVTSLAFSPDGGRLISGSDDRSLRVWEMPSGDLIDTIRSATLGRVLQVAYSPDGLWIAAADQFCLIQLRSARTGVLYRSLLQPSCIVSQGNIVAAWGLAFTPDGTRLLSAEMEPGRRGTVQSWQVGEYAEPIRIQGPNDGVRALALSSDGARLALAFASSAVPWVVQAETGEVQHELRGHAYAVRDLAISPDGRLLATASADQSVRVWSLEDGELLEVLEGHAAPVNSVAFSPDGTRLASGDESGVILIWGVT
jgi:WD40 repeat protein